jgi:hypothetical protein
MLLEGRPRLRRFSGWLVREPRADQTRIQLDAALNDRDPGKQLDSSNVVRGGLQYPPSMHIAEAEEEKSVR